MFIPSYLSVKTTQTEHLTVHVFRSNRKLALVFMAVFVVAGLIGAFRTLLHDENPAYLIIALVSLVTVVIFSFFLALSVVIRIDHTAKTVDVIKKFFSIRYLNRHMPLEKIKNLVYKKEIVYIQGGGLAPKSSLYIEYDEGGVLLFTGDRWLAPLGKDLAQEMNIEFESDEE